MQQYNVIGMHCSVCSNRIEKTVAKVPGVTSCVVSLLTNSMIVEGVVSSDEIIQTVEKIGYSASLLDGHKFNNYSSSTLENAIFDYSDILALRKRLVLSVPFLLLLLYLSMIHGMFGWWLPSVIDDELIIGGIQLVLAFSVMIINKSFFSVGLSSFFRFSPNMDTLVALGSSASFLYSLIQLYLMFIAQSMGNHEVVHSYSMNLYFESAAMIPTFTTPNHNSNRGSKS